MMRVRRRRNIRGTRLSADSWGDAACRNPPALRTIITRETGTFSVCFRWTYMRDKKRDFQRRSGYLLCQTDPVYRAPPQSSLSRHNCQKPLKEKVKVKDLDWLIWLLWISAMKKHLNMNEILKVWVVSQCIYDTTLLNLFEIFLP